MGTYAEAWQNNAPTSQFLYTGGIQLSLFKNVLNIYAPLIYSSDFNQALGTPISEEELLSASISRISIINGSLKKEFRYMNNIHDIRYLNRNEIETEKWDHCILQSTNGLIYARSFYLDAMAENWSALVSGDYEAVMPLTWNMKYGFTYLYQPYFTKTLGVFGKESSLLIFPPF